MITPHPGDRRFADLEPDVQSKIAIGWGGATPNEAAVVFDRMSVENRWEVLCTLPARDGSHVAEQCRITAQADPATIEAFDKLSGDLSGPVDLPLTELGIARRLVAVHGESIRYVPELRRWLMWDGTKWAEDITGEIERRAKDVVDRLHGDARFEADPRRREEMTRAWLKFQTAARLRAVVELAATEPGIPVTADQLDLDVWALNVGNGIVDLRTGDPRPHDPAEMCTKIVPIDYEAEASCPTWDKFLGEVFDHDEELIQFVQRFAGYSLTGDVREQLLVFAHGTGANGKSTMLGMLRQLAGDYGVQLDPAVLTAGAHYQHPTGLTDLRGARLVTTVETEANRRLAEALVKQLTGGDPIRARRMRGDYFEFWPTHTIWLAGNHLPAIRGTDLGIWRRIALVPFDVTFSGERQDPNLPAKLAAEGPGILAWAIRGCLKWQRDGLRVPDRVKAATADYRTSQDHLGRFIAESCVVDDVAYVPTKDLRAAYETWCDEQGERAWTAQAVGRELTDRGFDSVQKGAQRSRMWLGLGLVGERGEQI